ncbi:hypothetical protein DH2020_040245 [Rehmannia glutinosa]|uniref:Mitochondrial carrier protein n=1 Tax=Rehmannia glutinosa TaxID=99300 RepID=A0ABR0UUS4_REHGL
MEARVAVDGGSATRKFLHHHHSRTPPPAPQQQPQISQIGTVPQLLAGGIAGAFSKTCMHSDVAVMSKPSIWREALRIVNEEGFRAFWKGNLVTVAHRLPYSSVNFYAYEQYKSILRSIPGLDGQGANASADVFVHFVGGGLAGITAASVTYPLDLIRTRLAAQRKAMYYKGIRHALHTICRDEGFLGLYKGLGATLLGIGPSIAISFSVYEFEISLAFSKSFGIASSTATFPLDLVRRRMQLEGAAGQARVYNMGLFGTFGHIIRAEGLRGLYRGIMPDWVGALAGFELYMQSNKGMVDFVKELFVGSSIHAKDSGSDIKALIPGPRVVFLSGVP